jgi:hypothetical protein
VGEAAAPAVSAFTAAGQMTKQTAAVSNVRMNDDDTHPTKAAVGPHRPSRSASSRKPNRAVGRRSREQVSNERGGSMRKLLGGILATAAVVMVIVSVASGSSSKSFSAHLTASQETPPTKVAAAKGTFKATLTGTTLKWTLTYSGLTGAAQQAHIHLGKKGVAGNVAIVLCSSPSQCKSPMKGTAKKVPSSVIKALENGGAYVNVHTVKNPNGEIRGQIM